MRYFVPDIHVVSQASGSASGISGKVFGGSGQKAELDAPVEKLGGIPFGLPANRWPNCKSCGKSQSLLAQLRHHPERLDLGREGRTLFVFQCNHGQGDCKTWEAFSGANACLVVEPEDLDNVTATVPTDGPVIEDEVSIAGWLAREDGLSPSIAPQFHKFETFAKLDQETLSKVTTLTRLGGVPFWLQNPEDMLQSGWRFIGQLDSSYSFLTPPAALNKRISEDRDRVEGRTHIGRGPNFGDGGMAYLFLKEGESAPNACMLWQCF